MAKTIDDLVLIADTVRKLDRLTDYVLEESKSIKEGLKNVQAHNIVLKQENRKLKALIKKQVPYQPAQQV